MSKKITIVNDIKCDICGNKNRELVVFKKKVVFWSHNVLVCQKCMSRTMFSFTKGK